MHKHDYESSIKTEIFLLFEQLSHFHGRSSTVDVCVCVYVCTYIKSCIWTHTLLLLFQGQHGEHESHTEIWRGVGAYYQRFPGDTQGIHIKYPSQHSIFCFVGSYCYLHHVVTIQFHILRRHSHGNNFIWVWEVLALLHLQKPIISTISTTKLEI